MKGGQIIANRAVADQAAELRAAGLAAELDAPLVADILEDLDLRDESENALVSVLDSFYGEHSAAARRDGWVSCDWRTPAAELAASIQTTVGGAPLVTFVRSEERVTTERGFKETRVRVTFGTRHGEVSRDIEALFDVFALANEELARAKDVRRFFDLGVDDQVIGLLLTPEVAKQLATLFELNAFGRD